MMGDLPKVPEHHGCGKDHGGRVSPVGSHDIASDMSAAGLKKSVLLNMSTHFSTRAMKMWY
jgi:hypothetical protein